ncbi:MAG: hypothetical protein IJ111_07635 [Eggerthellaceae bacterium]|nr:hypothetical protein [Eggerthellaceae bacterium]
MPISVKAPLPTSKKTSQPTSKKVPRPTSAKVPRTSAKTGLPIMPDCFKGEEWHDFAEVCIRFRVPMRKRQSWRLMYGDTAFRGMMCQEW